MKTQHREYAIERVLRILLVAGAGACLLSAWVDCRAQGAEGSAIPDAPPPVVHIDNALPQLRIRTPGPGLKDLTLGGARTGAEAAGAGQASTAGEKETPGLTITPTPPSPSLGTGTIAVEEKSLTDLLQRGSEVKDEAEAQPLTVTPEAGSALESGPAPTPDEESAPPAEAPAETYHPPGKNGEKPGPDDAPADPFGDIPKYTDAWIPQDSLEFHNQVLVKVQARPTYRNLEVQREILESALLERYNNLLASAGRVGKVEMVMSTPIRYAKDGSWLKGEFEQIVHDIWGRRLPVYETDYYLVVLEN